MLRRSVAQAEVGAFSPQEGGSPQLEICEISGSPQLVCLGQHGGASPELSITFASTDSPFERQSLPQLEALRHVMGKPLDAEVDASPILLTVATDETLSSPPSEYVVGQRYHRDSASPQMLGDHALVEMKALTPQSQGAQKKEHAHPHSSVRLPRASLTTEEQSGRSPSSQQGPSKSRTSSAVSASPDHCRGSTLAKIQQRIAYSQPPQMRGTLRAVSSSQDESAEQLRKALVLSQARVRVLEDELHRAHDSLSNTSQSITVRETECVELNTLVDSLQAEVQMLKAQNAELRQRNAAAVSVAISPSCFESRDASSQTRNAVLRTVFTQCEHVKDDFVESGGVKMAVALQQQEMASGITEWQMKVAELEDALCERCTDLDSWRQYCDGIVHELEVAKLRIVEQQAVLDRLDLVPPYPEALVGSARMKKNLFVAL